MQKDDSSTKGLMNVESSGLRKGKRQTLEASLAPFWNRPARAPGR